MPLVGRWLAALGADVILVESRQNPTSRSLSPFSGEPGPNTSGLFNHLNLNKRSITLNLRSKDGLDLAKKLVARSDVVIENFSPGTMDRLGLGYETLAAVQPDIIMPSLQ